MADLFGFTNYAGLGMSATRFTFAPSLGFVVKDFAVLNAGISSFKEPLTRSVKEVMIPSIRKNFEDEGRPDSWEPLSDFSLEMRDKGLVRFNQSGATGNKILDATGNLKRRVTQMNLWTINSKSAEIRDLPNSIWYGKVHQQGYPPGEGHKVEIAKAIRKRVTAGKTGTGLHELGSTGRPAPNVPARPFLVMQPEDTEAVRRIFSLWMDERAAAFRLTGLRGK